MNYRIIGDDKREYGPVDSTTLRGWVTEKRADRNTLVQEEGSSEWKAIGSIPEFAHLFSASHDLGSPGIVGDPGEYVLDIGSCFGRGWALTKQHFWPVVAVTGVNLLIQCALGSTGLSLFASGILLGGLFWYYLKLKRGGQAEMGDSFAGFSLALVPLMLVGLISQLLIGVGYLLCILPGIYLSVAWIYCVPLVIDKKMDFWPAMELSRKVVSRHWWSHFWFCILMGLLMFVGVLALVVGVFIAAPVCFIALMYAYEDIFHPSQKPPA